MEKDRGMYHAPDRQRAEPSKQKHFLDRTRLTISSGASSISMPFMVRKKVFSRGK
jgi:hypothetical protein